MLRGAVGEMEGVEIGKYGFFIRIAPIIILTADHVAVIATTPAGAVVTLHAHSGARDDGTRFRARFHGTAGELEITSVGVRGLQIEELTARYCPAGGTEWQTVEVPASPYPHLMSG